MCALLRFHSLSRLDSLVAEEQWRPLAGRWPEEGSPGSAQLERSQVSQVRDRCPAVPHPSLAPALEPLYSEAGRGTRLHSGREAT